MDAKSWKTASTRSLIMCAFKNNIPLSTNNLARESQQDLLNNNIQLDASFGVDHYTFSNLTANNGFHNQVTTPLIVGAIHPTTAAAVPKFYAMQDSANLGVIQYSRGPSNAVPTPQTFLQSTQAAIVLAPSGTTNILDFTGLTQAIMMVYASDKINFSLARIVAYVYWTGAAFESVTLTTTAGNSLVIQNTGNILQLKNTSGVVTLNDVYWQVEFLRIN